MSYRSSLTWLAYRVPMNSSICISIIVQLHRQEVRKRPCIPLTYAEWHNVDGNASPSVNAHGRRCRVVQMQNDVGERWWERAMTEGEAKGRWRLCHPMSGAKGARSMCYASMETMAAWCEGYARERPLQTLRRPLDPSSATSTIGSLTTSTLLLASALRVSSSSCFSPLLMALAYSFVLMTPVASLSITTSTSFKRCLLFLCPPCRLMGFCTECSKATTMAEGSRRVMEAMERVMNEAFEGRLMLRNIVKSMLIPCYDLQSFFPLIFSHANALESERFDFWPWEVYKVMWAKPSRFEPMNMWLVDHSTTCVGIDDGLTMSNQIAMGITHVLHNKLNYDIFFIFSFSWYSCRVTPT